MYRKVCSVHVQCIYLCLMRLGRMSTNGRKSASPLCLLLLFANSASQPLYLNMFLSHLSITSFQSIFICVASHSLSQSISVHRERSCVSRWVSRCPVSVSFVFFLSLLPCEKLLRVFVTSSSHFHGDRRWLTALTEVSSSQGPGKAWRNACVCMWNRGRAYWWVRFYLWAYVFILSRVHFSCRRVTVMFISLT